MANCVEVARAAARVGMRDSKDPAGPMLAFAPTGWSAFLAESGETISVPTSPGRALPDREVVRRSRTVSEAVPSVIRRL